MSSRQYRYQLRNPDRQKARNAVSYALRTGRLTRGGICSQCGSSKRIEAHHHNGYSQEHRLDVVWLCSRCHGLATRRPKIPKPEPASKIPINEAAAALGKLGGKVKSKAKAEAARKNGKLGGRPKKRPSSFVGEEK